MSTSKHFDKICIAVVAVMLVMTVLLMNGASLGITASSRYSGYESRLFDNSSVHSIAIVMDDWETFIENCESEEYSPCTAVIDGKKYSNIGIRAKGNTSLSQVKSSGSQRYSFKIEFDHYESGKSYYGLDKLCLNNLIQDNTMMKDYLVYRMMSEFGVEAPLCSFVYITVNNEDWGLYLAVEGIEDAFMERNYGSDSGELYKPDSMSFGGGRGNGKDFNMSDFDFGNEEIADRPQLSEENKTQADGNQQGFMGMPGGNGEMPQMPEGGDLQQNAEMPQSPFEGNQQGAMGMPGGNGEMPQMPDGGDLQQNGQMPQSPFEGNQQGAMGMPGGNGEMPQVPSNGGGGGMGSDDVKLKYIDDDPDSYSNIFDNAKTDISNADKARLISALKSLNSYSDIENTVNVEEVIRYFVVHNFVCNGDSYTGSMIHNYYLHENDGILSMIPWDYNLAFGTFQGNQADSTINTSIDSPVSGGSVDDRPMLGWIFSDEAYTQMYHELFEEFISRYFSSGELEKMIEDAADMIRPYVEKDPTKFCTADEFEKGVEALSSFVSLRAQAVSRQLAGDNTAVDVGTLNLSDMGTMNNGMGGMDSPGMGGSFNVMSMISVTDKSGNQVDAASLIGDASKIVSITFSDGSTVNLDNFNPLNIRQTELSKIISITDSDGNVIDLSEYSISVNTPSLPDTGGTEALPGMNWEGNSSQSENNMMQPPNAPDNGQSNPGAFDKNGNGSNNPTGNSQDSESMRDNSDFGKDENKLPPSENLSTSPGNTWLLLAVSFVCLAVGLFIAVKKKY